LSTTVSSSIVDLTEVQTPSARQPRQTLSAPRLSEAGVGSRGRPGCWPPWISIDLQPLHLKSALGADTPLSSLTASRISEYKACRLSAVRKISDHEVGIGGVSHSEKESESQDRQQSQH
jgi:hypothetical protein